MNSNAIWIKPNDSFDAKVPVYRKVFTLSTGIKRAKLDITAMGVYVASLNGERVGDYIMAPGWTAYHERIQYQTYDITDLLSKDAGATNTLEVLVGTGWHRGRLPGWTDEVRKRELLPAGLISCITVEYENGSMETICTDDTWEASKGKVIDSSLYDGEIYDASFESFDFSKATRLDDAPSAKLVPQQGEKIVEQERVKPSKLFKTPEGDIVLDFGQNLTGYLEFTVEAKAGDKVDISHAEILDAVGNFYTENYRTAKAKLEYTCRDGVQTYKPLLTFYGFRYVRLNSFPIAYEDIDINNFTAVVVHSDIKRTGYIHTSNTLLNKLFDNIIWGQKGNFLDVPTDCPQRDERLGWTGDAEVFARTATYNFNVEKFFKKWLADLAIDQYDNGGVPSVIPDVLGGDTAGSAWGDAATIVPWEVYMTYGAKDILEAQFSSMKGWVDFLTDAAGNEEKMKGLARYGDWLGLDAKEGDYIGRTDMNLITTAYHVYSTSLVVKAGKALGQDVSKYEKIYEEARSYFNKTYTELDTQTACALAIHFGIADDDKKAEIGNKLAELVKENGNKLNTGFVGTPYIMHALSETGHTDVAYSLLLQDAFPSWLYPVTKGATTMWEHWDGVKEDGSFWSADMNSYNHYAYGAVADWMYGVAAGIKPVEDAPGFERIEIAPNPDARLGHFEARIDTKRGPVISRWTYEDDCAGATGTAGADEAAKGVVTDGAACVAGCAAVGCVGDCAASGKHIRYDITTPSPAKITIDGQTYSVDAGNYVFYSKG